MTSIGLENELKVLINAETYKKLLLSAHPLKKKIQENYYFDTEDYKLSREKKTLRIRNEKNHYILCLKIGWKKDALIHTSQEIEVELTESDVNRIFENPPIVTDFLPLEIFQNERPVLLGKIKNERTVIEIFNGILAEIDKTHFPNGISYEMEVENISESQGMEILKHMELKGYPYIFNKKSKYQRFVEGIKESP